MKDEIVVSVDEVSMRFNLGQEKIDNLKEYFIKFIKNQLLYKEFWALKNISLKVRKGEVFGIVGYNGSGKSTLLKIIAGVMKPTKGRVKIKGSMAPLIELGAGFDNNLTGRENVYLNGAILGYSKQKLDKAFDDILEFSELGNFIDVPVKNYSSGMVARLAFSIATIVEPQILIVDEVLSVGDYKFQEKCQDKLKKMIDRGTTVLFVSHSIKQVEELCDRVAWIDKGQLRMVGDSKTVCQMFLENK
ncbi:ABC transporter ATP-binding protein [Clostridium sp. YIM B02569]|uniref:ABC transporter ATP-binding protein n=1 Tax=Clostridium sp. YIM B02569 TaxID=2911967 RepID=UPI001EEB911A|nr:ABC transporter ATP-binding protein [Clostridium sp. YIM B02569]